MANRAYLYSINEIPTGTRNPKTKIIGLSEYSSGIPLSFQILLSADPRITQSIIFEDRIGIIGNYEEGVEHLRKYLDIFKKENVPNRRKFDEYYSKTFEFLDNKQNKQEYFQLEIGEILQIDPRGADALLASLDGMKTWEKNLKNVPQSARLSIGPQAETIIAQMMADWEWQLGIEYWSNYLYFDFSQNNPKN